MFNARRGSNVATSNSVSCSPGDNGPKLGDSILGITPESSAGFGFGGCSGIVASREAGLTEDLRELWCCVSSPYAMILATDVLLEGLALIVLVVLDIGVCGDVVAVSSVLMQWS